MKGSPFALGLLCIGLSASCGDNTELRPEVEPVPVRTVEVVTETRRISVHASGTVADRETAYLSFKVGGMIERIAVREGDLVEKGASLAALDQTESRALVKRAAAAFDLARQDLANDEKLHADRVIPEEQLRRSKQNWKIAQANLEIAEHNLAFASITAPTNGRILEKLGEVNEMIEAGRPLFLFSVSAPDHVFHADLTDRDIVRLSLGDSATVFLAAHPERAIPATVSELPATADPASGLYNVELTLFHSELTILQGMYGRVRIRTRYSAEGPAIPLDALANTDGDHGEVFVLNGTMVRKRAVTLGPIDGDRVQVRAGLAPGEIVIAEGGAYLRDKSPVIVIAPTEHRN